MGGRGLKFGGEERDPWRSEEQKTKFGESLKGLGGNNLLVLRQGRMEAPGSP